MAAGFDQAAFDRLAAYWPVRFGAMLCYVIGAVVVAFFFPDTPDELSRISIATQFRDTGIYDFFWPPGNVLLIVVNPLLSFGGLSDVTAVRLFNLLLSILPICVILLRTRSAWLLLVSLFTAPYCYLVLSTGSQQGVMVGLLIILCWAVATERLVIFTLTTLALYLVNPGMVLAMPLAFLLLLPLAEFRKYFLLACLGYLPILATALWISSSGGAFMPTLSGNGPMNVFLGNNPDPLSHRGVGTLEAARRTLGLDAAADQMKIVMAYLQQDPFGFLGNFFTKALLYWMPWDFLRSGMGQNVTTVLFTYIGLSQLVIYGTLWRMWPQLSRRQIYFALAFAVAAWALYTLFFVKVRFRVPFDLLVLFACLIGPVLNRRRDPA